MYKQIWMILIASVVLIFISSDAQAQWTKRSCRCDVTCSMPNGSTDRSLDRDWNDIYTVPHTSSDLSDCRAKCAGQISSSKVNSLANRKKVCGTMTCSANWEVGNGNGRRAGSSGTRSATYNGPECNPAEKQCCVPDTGAMIEHAFQFHFDGTGPTTDIFATYVGNPTLDSVYQNSLNLENSLNTNTNYLFVKYELTIRPTDDVVGYGYMVYVAGQTTPYGPYSSGLFTEPLENGNVYDITAHLIFWRDGKFFSKDCDMDGIFLDRTGGQSLRSISDTIRIGTLDTNSISVRKIEPNTPASKPKSRKTLNELPADVREFIQSGSSIHTPTKTEWTEWLNTDRPGGNGDYQTIKGLSDNGAICSAPIDIECRTSNTKTDWRKTGEKLTCDTVSGHLCSNKNQKDGRCEDYEVRYLCPSK